MNTKAVGTILLLVAQTSFAVDPGLFELHAVAEVPSATTKEYSLPERAGSTEKVLLDSAVLLDASALKSAKVVTGTDGSPTIQVELSESGAKLFGEITTNYFTKRLGIVVDGQLRLAPIIREPIWSGSLQISGNITAQDAAALVAKLNEKKPK